MTTTQTPTVTTDPTALAGVTCTSWTNTGGPCGQPAVVKSAGYWNHENYATCADCKRFADRIRKIAASRQRR